MFVNRELVNSSVYIITQNEFLDYIVWKQFIQSALSILRVYHCTFKTPLKKWTMTNLLKDIKGNRKRMSSPPNAPVVHICWFLTSYLCHDYCIVVGVGLWRFALIMKISIINIVLYVLILFAVYYGYILLSFFFVFQERLLRIWKGKVKSERHNIFFSSSIKKRDNLKYCAHLGALTTEEKVREWFFDILLAPKKCLSDDSLIIGSTWYWPAELATLPPPLQKWFLKLRVWILLIRYQTLAK